MLDLSKAEDREIHANQIRAEAEIRDQRWCIVRTWANSYKVRADPEKYNTDVIGPFRTKELAEQRAKEDQSMFKFEYTIVPFYWS